MLMKDCNEKTACMNRREFLVKAGLVAGAVTLTVSSIGSALGAAIEDVTVTIGADSPLAKVGGSQVIDTPAGKVIVIRQEKAKYVAFSARCTHKRAILGYNPETKELECPSHGSHFSSVDGKVTHGPADVSLPLYAAKGSDTSVVVSVTA